MPLSKITAASISDGTVVAADIANGAVTGPKLGLTSINANNIVGGAVTGDKLGATSINANNIVAGAITGDKLGATSINANNIVGGTITGTQISNTANITASTVSATVIPSNSFNYRNKFINGNFDFWQRATSGTPAAIWAYVSADRWGGHHDGTAGTYSRSTNVPNTVSTYSMRMTGTSGGGNAYLDQRIEASELREIIAKGSVTVSGWIRRVGGPTSTLSVNLICADATDNFSSYTTHGAVFTVNNSISGNGTASSSSLTLTDNNTWYYFSVTDTSIASRTNIANGAQIYFAVGGLDSNSKYFEFSQLQIEAGPNATPFEQRSIGTELQLCQRYYEVVVSTNQIYAPIGTGFYIGSADVRTVISFKQTKRAIPTLVTTSGADYYACYRDGAADLFNSFTINDPSTYCTQLYNNTQASGGGGQAGLLYSNSNSAYLAFSAEL